MATSQAIQYCSPEEYYVRERAAECRSEYFGGRIIPMAVEASKHSLIKVGVVRQVSTQLKGKRPLLLGSDMRIKVKSSGLRCYPDAAVYCDPLEYDPDDAHCETATNPAVVFEVLSTATEAYDRGLKAESYRTIDSLRTYVLISQARPYVEVHERLPDGTWRLSWAAGLDGVVKLPDIEVELSLAELYDRVDFAATGAVAATLA